MLWVLRIIPCKCAPMKPLWHSSARRQIITRTNDVSSHPIDSYMHRQASMFEPNSCDLSQIQIDRCWEGIILTPLNINKIISSSVGSFSYEGYFISYTLSSFFTSQTALLSQPYIIGTPAVDVSEKWVIISVDTSLSAIRRKINAWLSYVWKMIVGVFSIIIKIYGPI